MATKGAFICVRVEQKLKEEAEELFSSFGITVEDAINIFLNKVVMVGGLPFEVKIPKYNAETIEALKESEDIISGKIPDESLSVEDFVKKMNSK
ncbi:MAG: type II toxin-antitoxin system RelB/DinJ family antitoxin [Oscillospiraceae bacterium]|nr:type II toxin-antitoxin system RelB/DinJ family antitoxin [Oscillospiraceae bacterium]